MKKKRLGRGLGSLIGNIDEVTRVDDEEKSNGLIELDIDRIQRGKYQPRQNFDQESLQELADSIRSQGIVQPVVVRPEGDHFELVAGERRWRAAQLAGLQKVPAVIRELDARSAAAIALIENIQREDLNPLEEAHAFLRLIEEFDLTHQQVADSVGRSRAAVSNLLRLLDLADPVKQQVNQGLLDMGHARALLAL
jgi:ParB family chromosome partitioning protein